MTNISPEVFLCQPTLFKSIVNIYPPRIIDILNPNFNQYIHLLTISQEDIWDLVDGKTLEDGTPIEAPTPFEMLMINFTNDEASKKNIIDAFKFFTHEKTINILPDSKQILFSTGIENVKEVQELRLLTEDNYFEFQNSIRESIGNKPIDSPIQDDPLGIKAKIRRGQRVREKAKQSKGGISLTTSMAALCCMGIGINPLNIGEISYASMSLLMGLEQERERYNSEILFLAGGADPKKLKPKYWIRELTD